MRIEGLLTPYKLGMPVIEPSDGGGFDSVAVDCPMLFRHNGMFYMTYVGFDGIGYQTGLARSDDLIQWEKLGVILRRGSNLEWDKVGQACSWIIKDADLYGGHRLKKIDGRYWMIYHSCPGEGYEAGPASMGLAYTEDERLTDWHFAGEPVFTHRDGAPWERGGLYKCCVVENGGRYYMYYNAKNDAAASWTEQIGIAVSDDLFHWERCESNPILSVTPNAWDSLFNSDPCVVYDSENRRWVMFYYGFNGKNAMEGVAVSGDMYHFEKHAFPIIMPDGIIDGIHAHKPGIIYSNGTLYHFYCAVGIYGGRHGMGEHRTITLAASKPFR